MRRGRGGGRQPTPSALLCVMMLCSVGWWERPRALGQDGPDIVYAERFLDRLDQGDDEGVPHARGRLILLRSDGTRVVLADARNSLFPPWTPVDVADPSVSYDGTRIVFAGYSADEYAWRIYEVRHNGTGFHQVTRSDRELDLSRYNPVPELFRSYDDLDPCYLPDDRICFVSTRYPGVAPSGRERTTNLYVVHAAGGEPRRITTERFGADTPAVDPVSGRIVYSRWWLSPGEVTQLAATNIAFSPEVIRGLDDAAFPGVNTWTLSSIRPDGGGLSMFTGSGVNRALTIAHRPSFLPSGEVLWMFITQSPIPGHPGENGLRMSSEGPGLPAALGGPQNTSGGGSPPRPYYAPPGEPPGPPPGFFYNSAESLGGGRLLVTGYRVGETRQFDVYVQSRLAASSIPDHLFGLPDRAEVDAVPLLPRTRPPVIADEAPPLLEEDTPRTVEEAFDMNGSFRFIVENIHFNAGVDVPIATAPPVGVDLTIEFYMNPQRRGALQPEQPILIGSRPIGPDGRVEMELPAGVPLFEVLRTADGKIALGRDGQAFHVGGMNFGVAGTEGRCVGCHTGHSMIAVPEDPGWTNIASSAVVTASSVDGASAPELVVDRRTVGPATIWSPAVSERDPEVAFRWLRPILAREVVVHVPEDPTAKGPAFSSLRLAAELGGARSQEVRIEEPAGLRTAIPLDDRLPLESITLRLERGARLLSLAEVEVIGRLAPPGATTVLLRGDANCDARVSLSDAVFVLAALFSGERRFCCEAAADATGDGRLDVADSIRLLSRLFVASAPPAGSTDSCAESVTAGLGCEETTCP